MKTAEATFIQATLPDCEYPPTCPTEVGCVTTVTEPIATKLGFPESSICLWHNGVLAADMLVPVAAVNENHCSPPR